MNNRKRVSSRYSALIQMDLAILCIALLGYYAYAFRTLSTTLNVLLFGGVAVAYAGSLTFIRSRIDPQATLFTKIIGVGIFLAGAYLVYQYVGNIGSAS